MKREKCFVCTDLRTEKKEILPKKVTRTLLPLFKG
jgi:hypothetical protein